MVTICLVFVYCCGIKSQSQLYFDADDFQICTSFGDDLPSALPVDINLPNYATQLPRKEYIFYLFHTLLSVDEILDNLHQNLPRIKFHAKEPAKCSPDCRTKTSFHG